MCNLSIVFDDYEMDDAFDLSEDVPASVDVTTAEDSTTRLTGSREDLEATCCAMAGDDEALELELKALIEDDEASRQPAWSRAARWRVMPPPGTEACMPQEEEEERHDHAIDGNLVRRAP
jgi:hypothetical protein